MSGIFLRWGVPALLTVVGGTALAISATGGTMAESLSSRTSEALASADASWLDARLESRDALVVGVAPDRETVDAAVAAVSAVHGVRSVRAEVTIAESVTPFPFSAETRDGAVTLSGGIPAEELRETLITKAGATRVDLRLLSGAPAREVWAPATDYALEFLPRMESGRVTLSDLELDVEGTARTSEDFDELLRMAAAPPDAVRLGVVAIAPPVASPFTWRASFDGARLSVSGFTPSESFLEEVRSRQVGGVSPSTSLRLASGAPAGFEASARTLLENLLLLEDGTAEISDSSLALTGAPPDVATAERVRSAMTRIGARFDLAPPRLADYAFTAERNGETIVLGGHVPDAATRERLAGTAGVDASALELARGAPDRFQSAVDFGLGLLSHMSEGRFAIDGTSVSITGRAATIDDFDELETTLALGAPQGLILATADVRPPVAEPFVWSAVKADDGITFSGYVPSKAARGRLVAAAVATVGDTTAIADGAPADFESEAGTALELLRQLDSGEVAFDGANWSMTGEVSTSEAALAADRAFAASGLREKGWSFDIESPPPPEPPIVSPYVWTARKGDAGAIALTGHVPSGELQSLLVARAGEGASDGLVLGSGEPAGFTESALGGLDALVRLETGALAFDGENWSLTGEAETSAVRAEVVDALAASLDTSAWRIDIAALDAPPVVSPYQWAATKSADGRIVLSGYVSTEELRRFIALRAGEGVIDSTELGAGEPAGFVADALAGLEALGHLTEGVAELEEGRWRLTGTPQTPADAELAIAALGTTTTEGWVSDLGAPLETPTPDVTETAPAATPPDEPAVARNFAFSASRPLGGPMTLSGTVPTERVAAYLAEMTADGDVVDLSVSGELPAGFSVNAIPGVRTLASLPAGEFGLDGETWVFSAKVETEADRAEVVQQLAAIPIARSWETAIDLLPALDACRRRVDAFAGRNAILFQSGSARLADESYAAIDELAAYLGICPEAVVHIEGHTDSDGADDLNLALSVARAEAVVEALIERGVAYERLYAVGYGESLPVADNDTTSGKRANRRIAFSILDEHQ